MIYDEADILLTPYSMHVAEKAQDIGRRFDELGMAKNKQSTEL
jgi:hypothetical protein